jgi:hypothetical protein
MTSLMKVFLVVFPLMIFPACGTTWFANPATNPVIEDKVGQWREEPVGTLAVTADRRIVVVKLDDQAKFCAEPPPDVAENITEQLSLALKAQVKEQGGEFKFDDQLTKKIQALISRTQGVDIYRTGMYDICQLYLNGAISGDGVKELSSELLNVSKEIILEEIRLKHSTSNRVN